MNKENEVLDELRGNVAAICDGLLGAGLVAVGLRCLDAIETFGDEHPGLVDMTKNCSNCGRPWKGRYWGDGSADSQSMRKAGWKYIETCDIVPPVWIPQDSDTWLYGLAVDYEDNELWLLCPDCAEEIK